MSRLTILARIVAEDGFKDDVYAELIKLIPITRAEKGCIKYVLHTDNDNPNHFVFHEHWESRELWQEHMQNKHLEEYLKVTEGKVKEFILYELTEV